MQEKNENKPPASENELQETWQLLLVKLANLKVSAKSLLDYLTTDTEKESNQEEESDHSL